MEEREGKGKVRKRREEEKKKGGVRQERQSPRDLKEPSAIVHMDSLATALKYSDIFSHSCEIDQKVQIL